ncbi:hypothetical protein OPV22_007378 [Ensete ventricosum]|uniref:Uncharacterized protein n=1 Tax=Ensete ventricosum TaxID=4639 RepID=A0AAV8RNE5_ENSVE|nr:hypothetical protein OPV22_007378 [Ensete ventricosum]
MQRWRLKSHRPLKELKATQSRLQQAGGGRRVMGFPQGLWTALLEHTLWVPTASFDCTYTWEYCRVERTWRRREQERRQHDNSTGQHLPCTKEARSQSMKGSSAVLQNNKETLPAVVQW